MAASNESLVPRNKYLAATATVTLVIGLLQVTHVVSFPLQLLGGSGGSVVSTGSLQSLMASAGYGGLFVLMALESASLPVPSEIVLPLAGSLVATGEMDFWTAVLVSTVASLVGALVDYYLALKLGRPFVVKLLQFFKLHRNSLDRAERWFERSGQWTVFAARFIPVLRTVISLPAGLFEMKLKPFLLMTAVGCFIWSAFLIYAGELAKSNWPQALSSPSAAIDILSGTVALVSGAYVAYYLLPKVRRQKQPIRASGA